MKQKTEIYITSGIDDNYNLNVIDNVFFYRNILFKYIDLNILKRQFIYFMPTYALYSKKNVLPKIAT